MTVINAEHLDHKTLNETIRQVGDCTVTGCLGQRFIAAGMKENHIVLEGIPGNAMGAYLSGATITVHGNVQDAVGDTMNEGRIIVHGHAGDAVGYAMRGGRIYIRGNAGYRVGIHMKEYGEKRPVIVIGGRCGSFLGEYQAGGVLMVLGLHDDGKPTVSNLPCTGMHGGKLFLRGDSHAIDFPPHVTVRAATEEDMADMFPILKDYCETFGLDAEKLAQDPYTVVVPDTANPYKQMYVSN